MPVLLAGRMNSRQQRHEVRLRGLRTRHWCGVAEVRASAGADGGGRVGDDRPRVDGRIRASAVHGGLKPAAGKSGSPPSRTARRGTVPQAGIPATREPRHDRVAAGHTIVPPLQFGGGTGEERARAGARGASGTNEIASRASAIHGGLKPAAGRSGSPPSRTARRGTVPDVGTLPHHPCVARIRPLGTPKLSLPQIVLGEGQAPLGARAGARGASGAP